MDPEVEELYGLPLDEFIKARDALARARAKSDSKEAGAAVKALGKPSVVAWALNQLARRHPDAVEALLEVGARLRRAQSATLEGGDPDELRDATKAEAAEVQSLAGEARSILADAGKTGSATQEERLAATLRAVAVDDAAGNLLRRGVLTQELSPAGFGFGVGEGDEVFASLSMSSSRSSGTSQQKRKEQEGAAEAAERQRRRERDQELRAARETATRLEREADRAERQALEARQAAEAAAARAEELAREVPQK